MAVTWAGHHSLLTPGQTPPANPNLGRPISSCISGRVPTVFPFLGGSPCLVTRVGRISCFSPHSEYNSPAQNIARSPSLPYSQLSSPLQRLVAITCNQKLKHTCCLSVFFPAAVTKCSKRQQYSRGRRISELQASLSLP